MENLKRFKAGFTLIEMVVSISIITMVTVLFITNYHSTNKRTDLTMAAQNLVADLHMAQNNTLGLVKYNSLVPGGGWGISFNASTTSYILFADQDEPSSPGNPSPDYMKYDDTEGNVNYGARVTQLPSQIQILELRTFSGSSDAIGTPNQKVNVTFLPPDPQTNIYRVNAGATATALEIKLKETQNNSIKTVRINFLGLAEVID